MARYHQSNQNQSDRPELPQEEIDRVQRILRTIPGEPWLGLAQADRLWSAWQTGTLPITEVMTTSQEPLGPIDWDVVICGGTLGLFVAVALADRGWRVAIVERGELRGRDQEWNISRQELGVLVELGCLSSEALGTAIVREFNPVRVKFDGGPAYWVRDVLNLGVSPARLIALLKERFLALGGCLLEGTTLTAVTIHREGAIVQATCQAPSPGAGGQGGSAAYRDLGSGMLMVEPADRSAIANPVTNPGNEATPERFPQFPQGPVESVDQEQDQERDQSADPVLDRGSDQDLDQSVHPKSDPEANQARRATGSGPRPIALTTRLVLDAMGHQSPIVRQWRQGQKPDGVCLVVGTCASGFPAQTSADLLVSTGGIDRGQQAFWEAFPAAEGRTTYRFVYSEAKPGQPSLQDLFADYFRELPAYQGVDLADLTFHRALFGCFPSYEASPLQPAFDRCLPIGDSSGLQSPLSFGGFGALLRHLDRLVTGLDEALQGDWLDRHSLGQLLAYQPGLSVTWLFQRAMRVGDRQALPADRINQVLTAVFSQMAAAGDRVLQPFLQDVVQFPALSETLARVAIADPGLVLALVPQLGLPALLAWLRHYGGLALYDALDRLATTGVIGPSPHGTAIDQFRWRCRSAAWRYGSGRDRH